MDEHISDHDLFSLLEGIIGHRRWRKMKVHLSTCSFCESRYRSAGDFLTLIERSYPETAVEDVPQHLIVWAINHIPVSPVPQEAAHPFKELVDRIKKIVAVLSPIFPESAFVRGAPEAVRLLYTAEGMEIPLCAIPSSAHMGQEGGAPLLRAGSRWTLVGRLTDASVGGQLEVLLYSEGEKISSRSISDDEEFLFSDLLPGEYGLKILTSHDIAIDIPPFQIG